MTGWDLLEQNRLTERGKLEMTITINELEALAEKCFKYCEVEDIISHFVNCGIIKFDPHTDDPDEVFQRIFDNHREELEAYVDELAEEYNSLFF